MLNPLLIQDSSQNTKVENQDSFLHLLQGPISTCTTKRDSHHQIEINKTFNRLDYANQGFNKKPGIDYSIMTIHKTVTI